MVLPTVFNFSNWKPQPAALIFEDINDPTVQNISLPMVPPQVGSGTKIDPYSTTINYPSDFYNNNSFSDGDAPSQSFIWYKASGFGDSGNGNAQTYINAYVQVYPNDDQRLGVVMSVDIAEIELFINNVLNSSNAVDDLLNHNIVDPAGGTYSVGANIYDIVNAYSTAMGNDFYFMVFDLDNFGLPATSQGKSYTIQIHTDGSRATGILFKQYSDYSDNVHFIFDTSNSAPSNFGDFPEYNFNYNPHFKIDRTVEDDLGTSFSVSYIEITFILLDDNHGFLGSFQNTQSPNMSYDSVIDAYIVKFNMPLNFNYGKFGEMCAVLKYYTNAGTYVKYQRFYPYYSTNGESVFPTYSLNFNQPVEFHIALENEELREVVDILSGFESLSYPESNLYGSGLVQGTYSSIVAPNAVLSVAYITSKNPGILTKQFRAPGNDVVSCNGISNNSGGQGTITYYVNLGSAAGLVAFSRENYSIPDRESIELPIGTPIYDTGTLKSGYEMVYLNKPSGNMQAKVTITAPLAGTAWLTTMACPIPSTTISPNGNFTFSPQFPVENIVVPNGGSTFKPAKLGVDYSYVSQNTPDIYDSATYVAIHNLKVLDDNYRLNGLASRKLIYNDPYTSTPIYHIQLDLRYPGHKVIGSDINNLTDGDVRIRRAFLQSNSKYFVVNMGGWFGNISPYKAGLYIPTAAGKHPLSMMGGVEYVIGSQRHSEMLSVNQSVDIPMIDLMGFAYQRYTQQHYDITDPYHGNQGGSYIPKTTLPPGGLYPEISGSNGILNQPYSQPFYHKEVGDKFFVYRPMNFYSDGTQSGIITVTITDPVNGTLTSQIGPVPSGYSVPNSASSMWLRFDGYNAQTINVSISGNDTDIFGQNQAVLENVHDLLSTQTFLITGGTSSWVALKRETLLGSNRYVFANDTTDFTISYNGGDATYTAINPITLAKYIDTPRIP